MTNFHWNIFFQKDWLWIFGGEKSFRAVQRLKSNKFVKLSWRAGLPDGLFSKNPNLGKFLRALDCKMFIYFMAIWNILRTFGIFYDHLVHFMIIWYIFPHFDMFRPRKIWQPCRRARLWNSVFKQIESTSGAAQKVCPSSCICTFQRNLSVVNEIIHAIKIRVCGNRINKKNVSFEMPKLTELTTVQFLRLTLEIFTV
jgi:hypothetical protein